MTEDILDAEQLCEKYDANLKHCIEFSVSPGWLPLVNRLMAQLVAECPDVQIWQCKSKLGLRMYAGHGTRETKGVERLIADAEHDSRSICQHCGEPGKLIGWNVWCPKHEADRNV